jgi:hypothetical protein
VCTWVRSHVRDHALRQVEVRTQAQPGILRLRRDEPNHHLRIPSRITRLSSSPHVACDSHQKHRRTVTANRYPCHLIHAIVVLPYNLRVYTHSSFTAKTSALALNTSLLLPLSPPFTMRALDISTLRAAIAKTQDHIKKNPKQTVSIALELLFFLAPIAALKPILMCLGLGRKGPFGSCTLIISCNLLELTVLSLTGA